MVSVTPICTDCESVQKNKQNLAAIDDLRVVMAFLVVAIHIAPLSSVSTLLNYGVQQYLARLGVPFFFFCNGFFLFRPGVEGEKLKQSVFAQVKKLLWLYLAWTAVYLPIIIRNILKEENRLKACVRFVRDFFFVGSYAHLWYLRGSAVAIFLVWFCLSKKFSWKKLLAFAFAMYLVGLCHESWYGLVRLLPFWDMPFIYYPVKLFLKVIVRTRNGIFFGFLFVALGAWCANHALPPRKVCTFGFIASMLFGFAEAFFTHYFGLILHHDLYLFLPFAAFFLFCSALQFPTKTARNTRRLRKFSGLVYFIHYWFVFLYWPIERRLSPYMPILSNSLFAYGAVALCSTMFSLMILWLAERPRFAWMKRFY